MAEHSAVSEPVAKAMAEGARAGTGSDYALSITGYAGPDGEKVGLVFIGLAYSQRHRSAAGAFGRPTANACARFRPTSRSTCCAGNF